MRKDSAITMLMEKPAPWGLSRATTPLPEECDLYASVQLDPVTQVTHFHDRDGAIVDMATKITITKSRGGGNDGSGGSPQVADDSNTDQS
ncbi:putative ATP-grasp-modified RiPP [Streptosporangium sandarakinum]